MNEIAAKANGSISWPGPEARLLAAGLAVVVIADLLFWPHEPGIALFVFYIFVTLLSEQVFRRLTLWARRGMPVEV